MHFVEDAALTGTRTTKDGYLVADIRAARTGIQTYLGSEVNKPDKATVRVFRPETEVFAKDSMASFAGKPVTDDHPPEAVNATNWSTYAKGATGQDVARSGEFVHVPVMLMDAGIVDAVKAGKREVSMGYTMDLDHTPGVTPGGDAYDAVMTNLKMNHLAIVKAGRAGKECRVGDDASKWGVAPIIAKDKEPNPMATRQVIVDGMSVETTDQGAIALEKVIKDRAEAQTAHDAAVAAHDAAMAAKDAELAAKDAEIKKLTDAKLDDAAIDARVATRAKLIGDAAKIAADVKIDGLNDADARRAALVSVRGADAMTGKSDAYVEAAFDIAVEAADEAPTHAATPNARQAIMSRDAKGTNDASGYGAREKMLADAWKQTSAAA